MVATGGYLVSAKRICEVAGYDKIPTKLVRDAASSAAIFNQPILTGILPDDLKVAIISHKCKSGDKADCNNYRPISVLSAMAKVFEKLIAK